MGENEKQLRNKVLGCWYGKNIGGTLGMPFEWYRQLNNVDFYTMDLEGKALPNDDLDIQLLWLMAMEETKLNFSTRDLAYYFSIYVTPHWAEYGNAKSNMKLGIESPVCGAVNNEYRNSCGSYIRSEIWACIAAGMPALAAQYMIKDSSIDHGGNSEGTYAAVMVAAMEAAAFTESDIFKLIDIGLSYIPEDCDIAKVTNLVIDCYKSGKTYVEARDEVLRLYRGAPFCIYDGNKIVTLCSERDKECGFDDGRKGYDVPDNLGMVLIGLLYGEGDFGKSLCIAVNCGEDTDCTAATLGSLLGIIYGADKIDEKWIKPIGNEITTICLNNGEAEGRFPKTVDELTDRTMKLIELNRLLNRCHSDIYDKESELFCPTWFKNKLYGDSDGINYDFGFFSITVFYPDGPFLKGNSGRVRIKIENKYRVSENLTFCWYTENGFVADNKKGVFYLSRNTYGISQIEKEFVFTAEEVNAVRNNFVLMVTVEGRASAMTVPVTFIKTAEN